MANDVVRFATGLETNLSSEPKEKGKVLFAITGDDKGYIYFDKDNSTRIKMSEHATTAANDVAGNPITTTYIKSISITGDDTKDTNGTTTITAGSKGFYTVTTGANASTKYALPIASATVAGIVTNTAQTWAGAKTFSDGVTFSHKTFNYSGIEAGTTDSARVVWFADASYPGKPVYDNDFKYNPATNTLTVTKITGSAASLTTGHVFKVQDSYAAYTGAEVVFNGTQDVTLKLNKDTKFDNIRVVTTVRPETTNTGTLGNSSYYWKGAYISGREGSIHWNSLISVNSANNNPIVNVNTDRGLPRIFGRGDSYRPSNPFFGIPRSSIKVELTTDGGATWTDYSSILDVRHFYNENGMSATPGLNTAGTNFDQYDATSTSSTTGGGSSATYAANFWKNKGIRITFDTWDEYRYGWVDCIRLRFGTAGTNNKSHYIIERQNHTQIDANTWTTIYASPVTAWGNNDRWDVIYPMPCFYLSYTSTSSSAQYARKVRVTLLVDDWPTAYRYAPRLIMLSGYGYDQGLDGGASRSGSEFARFMVNYREPFIIEDRITGALGFDSDLLPRQRVTEKQAVVTNKIHNIGGSSRRWNGIFGVNADLSGNLTVSGTTTFGGAATFNGNLSVKGNLSVTGTTTMTGALTVNNQAQFTGPIIVPAATTTQMPVAGGVPWASYNDTHGLRIYSDGIGIKGLEGSGTNDAFWLRHTEATANTGIDEIAIGDDATEKLVVRQYNTSNNVAAELTLIDSGHNSYFRNFYPVATKAYDLGNASYVWNSLTTGKINLYAQTSQGNYGRISYYAPTYVTWITYMANNTNGHAPTGGKPSSLGNVTTWAMRSLVEQSNGYGWLLESTTNSTVSTNTIAPTPRFAVSSYDGQVTLTGDIYHSSSTRTAAAISFKAQDANGTAVIIGDGSLTVIGGGESAQTIGADPATYVSGASFGTEQLWLTADAGIRFFVNADTAANNKQIYLDTDLNFYPLVNATGSIGTNSYHWKNAYLDNAITKRIIVQDTTTNSNAYDATTPTITFKNSGGDQCLSLVFSDYDSIATPTAQTLSPSSLTLIGNQGGEQFVAPKVRVGGYINNTYDLSANTAIINSWIRTMGDTGWYSESHGGGWYMSDNTWIRSYGNKSIYQNTGTLRTDGTLQVGNAGVYFQADSSYIRINRERHPNTYSTMVGITPLIVFAMKSGRTLYDDSNFYFGNNNVSIYNNSGGGTVVHTRGQYTDFGLTHPGNGSGYVIQIKTTGTASPGVGGFVQSLSSNYNKIFVQIFRALVPTGRKVNTASNSMGASYQDTWITEQAGTGKWEWYARIVHCGNSTSFSNGGHVYLDGAAGTSADPVVWYLASCNAYEITDEQYDAIKAQYIEGTNSANVPAGALLRSGRGRADNATGDTWIFWDTLGGTSSPWGIKHNQAADKIEFIGSGTVGASITLNTGEMQIGNLNIPWSKAITFFGKNNNTSPRGVIGYYNTMGGVMHCQNSYQTDGALYISSNGATSANDNGGIAIDNEGVTVFGAGDAGDNFTGIFRVINEDSVATGPVFIVRKNGNTGIGTAAPSQMLHVAGNARIDGHLEVGYSDAAANTGYATANVGANNYITFYGVYGDAPAGYSHTYIGERIWGSKTAANEASELFIFKGNDVGNGTSGITTSGSGPDRIRMGAAAHVFQTYASALSGTFQGVAESTALITRMELAHNQLTSYVPTVIRPLTNPTALAVDNTAFRNTLTLCANQSNESSNETFTETNSSWGITFKRQWNNGTENTSSAGIYAVGSGSWRTGMAFRVKNNTTNTGSHDITALWISPAGRLGIGTLSPTQRIHVANGNIRLEGSAIQQTTRIYPYIHTAERSQWYKVTFPFYNATTGDASKWFMLSFDLHFGGGYNNNASGVAHVAFYWTRAANNGAWSVPQCSAEMHGILADKVTMYYRIAEPGLLYINNTSNNYNGIWIDNLYCDDTAPSLDWTTTKVETTSAITIANYLVIPAIRFFIDGNTPTPIISKIKNNGATNLFKIPDYTGTGWAVTAPDTNAVGSTGQPVYIAANGRATAIDWHIGNSGVGEHNANNITYNMIGYYTSNGPVNTQTGATTSDGAIYAQAYSSSWVGQIAQDYRNGNLFVRGKNNGTWQPWKAIATADSDFYLTPNCIAYDPATRKFTKYGGGTGSWDAEVYSKVGYKECRVTYKISQTDKYIMVGLNSDPTTNASYSSIDYCWYTQTGGALCFYENGSSISAPTGHTTYAVGDEFIVEYSNGEVKYYHNGDLCRVVARNIGSLLYMDSSFHGYGSIYGVTFEPIREQTAQQIANKSITIQTGSSAQQHISDETLINWLISKNYIPNKSKCHVTIQCSWSYAGNDILKILSGGINFEIQLAGCLIDFEGYAQDTYNNSASVYRLIIHTSPTNSFTADTGYTKAPGSSVWEYFNNGSSYSPTWRCISHIPTMSTNGYVSQSWGNTTGTGIVYWNDSTGGSIELRRDNPSSGKMSIKVDGRFYGNEGANPAMLMNYTNSYWGMGGPDAQTNDWIRTTSAGIIPYQSGGIGSGHCGLGTSSWYFSTSYIDTMYTKKLDIGTNDNNDSIVLGTNKMRVQWGTIPTYITTKTDQTPNYMSIAGLNISQTNSETSGIQFNGDYITMWSPCDGYSLVYFDEDSGDVVWKIDSSANFSGKAANVTGTVSVSNGGTGQTSLTSGYVLLGNGTSAISTRAVCDSTSASAISTNNYFVTERDIYYGLPYINNSHSYTSSTTIYAPTAGGTTNYVLAGAGTTSAPVWRSTLQVPTSGDITAGLNFRPQSNNNYTLGSSSYRWSSGYINTALYVGTTSYTSSTSSADGTYIGQGYIDLSATTPYIDFHANKSTSDYTARIIAESDCIKFVFN